MPSGGIICTYHLFFYPILRLIYHINSFANDCPLPYSLSRGNLFVAINLWSLLYLPTRCVFWGSPVTRKWIHEHNNTLCCDRSLGSPGKENLSFLRHLNNNTRFKAARGWMDRRYSCALSSSPKIRAILAETKNWKRRLRRLSCRSDELRTFCPELDDAIRCGANPANRMEV